MVRFQKVRRGHRGHGMYAEKQQELGRPCGFLSKEQRAGLSQVKPIDRNGRRFDDLQGVGSPHSTLRR